VDLADLQSERRYRRYAAYVQAKSANMLFALELAGRLQAAGSTTRSLAAQPGWTRSGLGPGDAAGRLERTVIGLTGALFAHAPERGAQPVLAAAVRDLPGGTYVTRRHLNQLKGAPVARPAERIRVDPAQQAGLWTASEQVTGVAYEALGAGEPLDRGRR
jgi:NAD(P)-dependent dehydrogenase (short-subunit alcohol dehydrogenase family)